MTTSHHSTHGQGQQLTAGSWQGYQGAQTLLREVTLDAELGALLMNPLPEMAELRGNVLFSGPVNALQPANATEVCKDASLHLIAYIVFPRPTH